ncbi:hypothetical protein Tco_0580092 [Tanacetum coccineum]
MLRSPKEYPIASSNYSRDFILEPDCLTKVELVHDQQLQFRTPDMRVLLNPWWCALATLHEQTRQQTCSFPARRLLDPRFDPAEGSSSLSSSSLHILNETNMWIDLLLRLHLVYEKSLKLLNLDRCLEQVVVWELCLIGHSVMRGVGGKGRVVCRYKRLTQAIVVTPGTSTSEVALSG